MLTTSNPPSCCILLFSPMLHWIMLQVASFHSYIFRMMGVKGLRLLRTLRTYYLCKKGQGYRRRQKLTNSTAKGFYFTSIFQSSSPCGDVYCNRNNKLRGREVH